MATTYLGKLMYQEGKPRLGAEVYLPPLIANELGVEKLRSRFTVRTTLMDGEEVVVCAMTEHGGAVGIPRDAGLKLISKMGLGYEDDRSLGHEVEFSNNIELRPEQIGVAQQMMELARHEADFVVRADTGMGKTVLALDHFAKVGRTAAVVVDQQNLLEQWVEAAKTHLGLADEEIGIVQGPKEDFLDKKLVICMIQTLVRRDWGEDFRDYFHTTVFDECHVAGAETYSRSLPIFNCRNRIGLSATPKRKDALNKLLVWSFGEPKIVLEKRHPKSKVYILKNETVFSWSANNSKLTGRYINEIAADGERNLLLARAIKWLYESGRDTLVVSDRVNHLSDLMSLCKFVGVPESDMGLYAKQKAEWCFEKNPTPRGRPVGWDGASEYTPIHFTQKNKTIPKEQREEAKETKRVVFATYGVFSKGVDEKRLSAGIDATPRSEATQVFGRILRRQEGKLTPIWVTVMDVNSFRSVFQLSKRIRDYKASNAEVYLWHMEKGVRKQDADELARKLLARNSSLRRKRIATGPDGGFMV